MMDWNNILSILALLFGVIGCFIVVPYFLSKM